VRRVLAVTLEPSEGTGLACAGLVGWYGGRQRAANSNRVVWLIISLSVCMPLGPCVWLERPRQHTDGGDD
jgi:hypothetical protein